MHRDQEWLDEPNKLEWQHEGYECVITRDPEYGNLCGWVGLKSGHPWYGKETGDREIYDIDVHGQIAWADSTYPIPGKFIKGPMWWLGFHGAAGRDYRPFYKSNWPDGVYRNMAFMRAECEKLVRRCQDAVIKEDWRKKVAVSVDKIEAQINQDMLKNLMLQIIDHGYASFDTYNRGRGGGVLPRYDNLKLIQATNMLIDMVKWGKFKTAEKEAKDKEYTCECRYRNEVSARGDQDIVIDVCQNKDEENIRLCKLATKIWRYLRRSLDGRGFGNVWMQIINSGDYCEVNTELRLNVFKTLAEEANAKP